MGGTGDGVAGTFRASQRRIVFLSDGAATAVAAAAAAGAPTCETTCSRHGGRSGGGSGGSGGSGSGGVGVGVDEEASRLTEIESIAKKSSLLVPRPLYAGYSMSITTTGIQRPSYGTAT